ncbi:hypothetical protein RHSIM_Rhsim10G0077300 [Rhododendron simsii]|uniref:CCHC-type domain-containing protein n=1 Tax=Rhododendron simsii TaxID=118357 RepID=A0A834GBH1_RHOSS|nr:hypothetical protein RHSIM_Rhsim10G0077300 [Rhododendron simsii]
MAEPDIIDLDASFDDSPHRSRHTLVGKIISCKSLNKKGVSNVITKAWRTREEVSVSAWGNNTYAFCFKSEDDLCKIISLGPWSVMGCLMVLRKWDGHKTLEEIDFSCSPFWVQIQGLPLGFLNTRSGMRIAETLGDVIAVEDPDGRGKLNKFLRVRVWIDVTKPLKKGFFLKRVNEEDLWVKFRYERLSNYCYGCGRIGHTQNDCLDSDDSWKQQKGGVEELRAEISWLDTIQYGDKQLEKLVYPRECKRNPTVEGDGGEICDGGACQSQSEARRDEARRNILRTEEVVHENVGNMVVQPNSGQVSPLEDVLPGQRIKMTDSLSHEGAQWKCLSVENTSRVSGLDPGQSKDGPNTTNSQYFVEELDSPKGGPLMIEGLDFGNLLGQSPIKEVGHFQSEVGLSNIFTRLLNLKQKNPDDFEEEERQRKKALLIGWDVQNRNKGGSISSDQLIPSQNFVSKKGKTNPRSGSNRGGRGSRGRPRKNPCMLPNLSDQDLIEVQVEHSSEFSLTSIDNSWLNDDMLSEVDSNVGAEPRAPVAGPEQPRTRW